MLTRVATKGGGRQRERRPGSARLHIQCPTIHLLTVEPLDRRLGLRGRGPPAKPNRPRAPDVTIHPDDPTGLVASVDAVLADNRFPDFVRPICLAARDRGLPVVLDADRPTQMSDDLFRIATHVVFSSECLRATTGLDDLAAALARIADLPSSFLAVTQGAQDVLWREGATLRRSPVFAVNAVDTLGAGDVFHGAFTLALAEGKTEIAAMRFAAAAAGLKCARLGGSAGAPHRAEVDALLAAP